MARLGLRQSQGSPGQSGVTAMPPAQAPLAQAGSPDKFADPLTGRLATFVRSIGIEMRAATLTGPTFLPGLEIRDGAILVDEARLTYPGDILHEAGHIAVADPAERHAPTLSPSPGDELATIAWSYAALRHLDIDPAVVFQRRLQGRRRFHHRELHRRALYRRAAPAGLRHELRAAPRSRKRPATFSPHAALDALTQRILP